MTDRDDMEPNTLDTEEGEEDAASEKGKQALEESAHLGATREEAAWEAQADTDDSEGDEDFLAQRSTGLDEEEESNFRRSKNKIQKTVSTIEELLLEELPRLSDEASQNLRAELTGSLVLDFSDGRKSDGRYYFEWKGQDVVIQKVEKSDAQAKKPDCTLSIDADDFFEIARGKLNPQVAMLSEKVNVQGKLSLAVYFFNLFSEAHIHP